MGLFLAPTSGNAVGRGYTSDPPPPGIDVDNVNRTPLRLLKQTLGKHKVKRLKIVPPGRQRGEIAPPYSWDAIERDDWKYELPKPHVEEGEFITSPPAGGHPTPGPQAHPTSGLQAHPDPRHARVDAIKKELDQLRLQVKSLNQQAHELTQAGKSSLSQRPAFKPSPTVQVGRRGIVSVPRPVAEAFSRQEPDAEREARMKRQPPGPAEVAGGMRWIQNLGQEREQPLGLGASGSRERRQLRKSDSERLQLQRHHDQEKRAYAKPPQQSGQIIAVHNQIAQKHQKIAMLVNELKQLRMQMKQTHESYRLTSNNLRRLSLLLK